MTDFDALQRAVAATVERFGAIDVAIANAGIAFTGPLATAPIEQVERTLAVNLLGVWRTDRAVIEQITQRRGYLLNISSLQRDLARPDDGPLHDRQGRRRGAQRRAAHGDRAERRRASAAPTSASSTPTSCAPPSPQPSAKR